MSRARWLTAGMLILSVAMPAQAPGISTLSWLHAGDVVLFQGDSITDGGRQRTGSDYNHIMGQDYAYMLAGQIGAAYPERNLKFVNRGISGNRVSELAVRWQADTLDQKPNVLSILVGVNDTFFDREPKEDATQFEALYDQLLGLTMAALPKTKIVIGEPFLLPVGKYAEGYPAKLNELKLRQAAVARLAAKYHLPLVYYQAAFDAACRRASADHWSWDGVHPTYSGHWLMAQEWLKTTDAAWGSGR